MEALGQPSTLAKALTAFQGKFGYGLLPDNDSLESMIAEYYDPAPPNWKDNENVSGNYSIPGTTLVVIIEKGKVINKKDYSQSGSVPKKT